MAPRSLLIAFALIAPLLLVGCIGTDDAPTNATDSTQGQAANTTADWARPLPSEITGLEHLTQVDQIPGAGGLWTEGDYAYVSGQSAGFYIFNISTPENPQQVANLTGNFTRDVDLLHYPNRTVAVAAASGSGMVFIDVTNPQQPERIATILGGTGGNVHNVAVAPGTHIVYNSRSVDTPGIDVVNASDPENPEVVNTFGTLTCHDVTFDPPRDRAFCPGVRETQIWDITNPTDPSVIGRVVNPAINIHHWATVTNNGSLLIIGDEFAGSTDAAAGCWAAQDNPITGSTVSDPVGAAWFYDISDPMTPLPQGWIAPELPQNNVPPTPCTAHFGEVLPGHDKMVIGWRAAGTYLVDFTDPTMPSIVDHVTPVGDNWEAVYHNGYVFTGDTTRGMDVFTFTGPNAS